MRKRTRTVTAMFLTGIMLVLSGCNSGSDVRSDVAVEDIAMSIRAVISTEAELTTRNDSYVSGMLRLDISDVVEYYVANVGGLYVDEIGVLKGRDKAHAGEIYASVQSMLQLRLDTWMNEYMPEEKPKLANAECKQLGNYVVYVILSDENRAAALKAFEDALK